MKNIILLMSVLAFSGGAIAADTSPPAPEVPLGISDLLPSDYDAPKTVNLDEPDAVYGTYTGFVFEVRGFENPNVHPAILIQSGENRQWLELETDNERLYRLAENSASTGSKLSISFVSNYSKDQNKQITGISTIAYDASELVQLE